MSRDNRTYIRVHDGMPDHPKIDCLSDAAFRLLITLWCWSSRHLTDGVIPVMTWTKRGSGKAREELLRVGLASISQPTGETIVMHDYLAHQRSRDEVAELRAKRAAAGKQGGIAKANALASATANGRQAAGKNVPYTETETEVLETSSSTRVAPQKRGTRLPKNWTPTETDLKWLVTEGITDAAARRSTEKFRDHWLAASGQSAVKLDWSAAWKNWLRTDADRAAPRPTNNTPAYTPWGGA